MAKLQLVGFHCRSKFSFTEETKDTAKAMHKIVALNARKYLETEKSSAGKLLRYVRGLANAEPPPGELAAKLSGDAKGDANPSKGDGESSTKQEAPTEAEPSNGSEQAEAAPAEPTKIVVGNIVRTKSGTLKDKFDNMRARVALCFCVFEDCSSGALALIIWFSRLVLGGRNKLVRKIPS